MLSLFPRNVLDEIWELIRPVSEGFPTYFRIPNEPASELNDFVCQPNSQSASFLKQGKFRQRKERLPLEYAAPKIWHGSITYIAPKVAMLQAVLLYDSCGSCNRLIIFRPLLHAIHVANILAQYEDSKSFNKLSKLS